MAKMIKTFIKEIVKRNAFSNKIAMNFTEICHALRCQSARVPECKSALGRHDKADMV